MEEGQQVKKDSINKEDLEADKTNHTSNVQISSKSKKSLSTTTIIASAGAAVTASLLTSKLTGYLNSMAIVAVTSIVIAIASEAYSRVLKKMRKVSAKALTIIPLPEQTQRRLELAAADTAQIEPIVTTLTSNASTNHDSIDMPVDDTIPHKTVRSRLKSIVDRLSWTTRMIIMVMIIAIMSIGASWLMTTIIDRPNVTNVTESVTRKEVINLSDSEKKAIQDAAVNAVQDKISSLTAKINDQSYMIIKLDDRISVLESSKSNNDSNNSTASQSPSMRSSNGTTPGNQDEQDEIDSLNDQMADLKKSMSSLQNEVNTLKSEASSTSSSDNPRAGSSSND
jgi:hypothetical protein